MGRGEDSNRSWIKTGEGSARLPDRPESKRALGYSPTLKTASGAGAHGGGKRRRARKARREERAQIRRGEFD